MNKVKGEIVATTLEEFLEIYGDLVYRIALQNMRNKADAEDLTQDVYMKILQKMPSFDDVKSQRAWIIRVCINACKDRWRYMRIRRTIEIIEPYEISDEDPPDYGLIYEVMKLPHKYRNVIYLFYYEDMSVNEISQIMNKKEATILTQLHRARKLLKGQLEEGEKHAESL